MNSIKNPMHYYRGVASGFGPIAFLSLLLILIFTHLAYSSQPGQKSMETLWQQVLQQSLMSDSARVYLEDFIRLAQNSGEKAYEAEAHYLLGKHFFLSMQDVPARLHFHTARQLFLSEKNWEKFGFSNVQMALSFVQSNMLDSALLFFQQAIQVYTDHDLQKHQWTPLMGISSAYNKSGNLPEAFRYGQLAVSALEATNDRTSKVIVLKYMLRLARDNDSLRVYAIYKEDLLKLYTPFELEDKIVHHIDRFVDIPDPDQRISEIYSAIHRLEEWPVTMELISSYLQLGQSHLELQDKQSAIEAWEKAYMLEKDSLRSVHFTPALLKALSLQYEDLGQPTKALTLFRRYAEIKDSLTQEYARTGMEKLQAQFETKLKDTEIAEQKRVLQQRTMQRNLIVGIAALLFIVGCFGFFIQRRHLQDQSTIAKQNEVLHQKEISALEKKHEVDNLQLLITTQEEERKRIAQDLHDSIGSLMATLKIKASHAEMELDHPVIASEMSEQVKLIDTINGEVRRIARNMMPPALLRMGLSVALEDLANALQHDKELHVSFQNIDFDQSLEQDKEITLYRIAQELCTNVLKHAQASHLLIQLSRHNGTATLVVEDDGIGFEPAGIPHQGIGMESIRSRVKYLGGEMEVWSSPSEGTSITVQIPVS